ncbi:MAG TPA: c-type cytochrome [Terriglobales bacterium]|nr:c-type cytochrome [Terriglobales bacterium]
MQKPVAHWRSQNLHRYFDGVSALFLVAWAILFVAIDISAQVAPSPQRNESSASGNTENGRKIYMKDGCYECHGRAGQGSRLSGPKIGPQPIPFPAFVIYIRAPQGQMPPYTSKVLSDAELADIYVFLKSLPQPPDPKSIPALN